MSLYMYKYWKIYKLTSKTIFFVIIQHLYEQREIDEDSKSDDTDAVHLEDDALGRVLGREPPGYVRGRGFGATLKKLEVEGHIKSLKKSVYDELRDLKAWKQDIESLLSSGRLSKTVSSIYFIYMFKE